jgi:DNA-binding FadR family transcriptional regulator
MKTDSNPRAALGRNLTYGLLDTLGRTIVTGGYDGRSFPTEAELAAEHNVSRSVTREAVKMLTAKGLLSARPRQGTIVLPSASWNLFDADILDWLLKRKFSIELLRQFMELRFAIEPAAAALAATNANAAGLALVQRDFGRMAKSDQGEDDPLESDIAFHVAILQASGNPFFSRFRDVVTTALRTSIRITNRTAGRGPDLEAHGAVMEAIVKRRPSRARNAMETLLIDTRALIDRSENSAVRARKKRK